MIKILISLILLSVANCYSQSVSDPNSINPILIREIVDFQTSLKTNEYIKSFIPISIYSHSGIATSKDLNAVTVPQNSCSIYDDDICHNVSQFYSTKIPQVMLSGLFFVNSNDAYIIGVNTGYDSQKLVIKPSIAIGYSTLFEIEKNKKIVIEGAKWFGGNIKHEPCKDTYDREYYCGNLMAWSDFNYQSIIESFYIRFFYQLKF